MKIIPCAWKTGTRIVDGYIVATHHGNGGRVVCAIVCENGEMCQADWNDLKVRKVHDQPEALLDEILYKRPDFDFKTPEGDQRVPGDVFTPEALEAFEPLAPAETPKPAPRVSRRSLLSKDK